MSTRFAAPLILSAFLATTLPCPMLLAEETHHHTTALTDMTLGALKVSAAYAIATLPNQPVGGGFLTITNSGTEPDRLVAVASPMAGTVEVHEMKMDGDMMKMSALPGGLVIPAGASVALVPGGNHLMFMDLTAAFVKGGLVPVTLTFEKAGVLEIDLPVLSRDDAAALAPAHKM